MFDLSTALNPRARAPFTGYYYKSRPNAPDDEHEPFDYEMVDPTDKRFKTLAGNILNTHGASLTIRVVEDIDFDIENGYVYLQDEHFYTIESDMKDYSTAPAQAFRWFKSSAQITHVLRLVQAQAPWNEYDG